MSEESGEINGGFSMDSSESRWVFHEDEDEDVSDIEEYQADLRFRGRATVPDSEDEDNAEQKLIRTGPRIDSFDVEALEIPGAHRNDYEVLTFSLFLLIMMHSNFFILFLAFVTNFRVECGISKISNDSL
jgi:hypothetical protein